jgi:hypothetical protein
MQKKFIMIYIWRKSYQRQRIAEIYLKKFQKGFINTGLFPHTLLNVSSPITSVISKLLLSVSISLPYLAELERAAKP